MSYSYSRWGDPGRTEPLEREENDDEIRQGQGASSLGTSGQQHHPDVVGYDRPLQRIMDGGELPMTGSPKVRVRKIPERPLPSAPSTSTATDERQPNAYTIYPQQTDEQLSPRSPLVERTAQQTPSSPGPEAWRLRDTDTREAHRPEGSVNQEETSTHIGSRGRPDIHPTVVHDISGNQAQRDKIQRRYISTEQERQSIGDHQQSWTQEEEDDAELIVATEEMNQSKINSFQPSGGEEGVSERTEEEELKDEIEQSMRKDNEKIKEQMESIRKIRVSDPKRASLSYTSKRKSGIFSLHRRQDSFTRDNETQTEINRLLAHLKNTTVETLANNQRRKVIAMSGGLNITQAYDFFERHGISSAPVYDEEGRTVGTIDSSDLMAYILISERPSLLQEVLRSNYDKDPFTKPVSQMIGASGRNQFTMVRARDTAYYLLQLFSLGRPSTCVLDNEDMISWVVSQSSLVASIAEYLDNTGAILGNVIAADLNVIVSKIPYVKHDTKAGEAFVSLCIHQAPAAVVLDEKHHLIAEISSQCFKGMTKLSSADFYLPIEQFLNQTAKKLAGWGEHVTCKASITLRELLELLSSRRAHRVWVVEGRRNKVVGMVTLTSIIRSVLGVGCLYDQKPPVQGKSAEPIYFDITDPDHWPHLRNK